MVKQFFLQTTGRHLALIGTLYFLIRLATFHWGWHPRAFVIVLFLPAVAGALYYPWCVKRYRPIPRNPIQEFDINRLIAVYSLFVAVSLTIPFACVFAASDDALLFAPIWGFVYLFFLLRLIYTIDYVAIRDVTGRQLTNWQARIADAKRCPKYS